MGPRSVFAALILVFSLALVFATLTTVQSIHRHTSTTMRTRSSGELRKGPLVGSDRKRLTDFPNAAYDPSRKSSGVAEIPQRRRIRLKFAWATVDTARPLSRQR